MDPGARDLQLQSELVARDRRLEEVESELQGRRASKRPEPLGRTSLTQGVEELRARQRSVSSSPTAAKAKVTFLRGGSRAWSARPARLGAAMMPIGSLFHIVDSKVHMMCIE